jgi:hypothetical protein
MEQDLIKFLSQILRGVWPNSPKEILEESIRQWYESGSPQDYIIALKRNESDDFVLVYSPENDCGHITCEFVPVATVEKIIKECARIYDEAAASYDPKGLAASDPSWREGARDEGIRGMSVIATRRLLINLHTKLHEALEDNFEESMLFSEMAFRGRLKMFFEAQYSEEREPVDGRQDIDRVVERKAREKREHLTALLSNVPSLRVPKGRGGSEPEVKISDQQCVLMSRDYPALLTHWKNVRRLRNNDPNGNWRGYAKLDCADTPDDLLDQLTSLDPYESKPSALAHQHVARRYGVPKDVYSLSTLTRLRRRGDNIRSQSKAEFE